MSKPWLLPMLWLVGSVAQAADCDVANLAACSNAQVSEQLQFYLVNYDSSKAKLLQQALIDRGAADEAVALLAHGQGAATAYWALDMLDALRSTRTDALVRPLATDELSTNAYCANLYFADVGDAKALANLNHNYARYEVPAYSWSTVMYLFGKYHFKPASENLVASIVSGNISIADAAIASLVAIYQPPKKQVDAFGNYQDIQAYFKQLIASKRAAK